MGIKTINKKGLQLKNAFFAVIAFSMIILAAGTLVGEWGNKYDSGLNYDLSEDYSDIDTFSNEANEQRDRISPQDPDPGTGDLEGKIFRGGYGILGRMFTPFRSVFNMLESLENRFGLPRYIGESIQAMIYFALITTIIAILFRLGRPSA
jgi:hypothetical protein